MRKIMCKLNMPFIDDDGKEYVEKINEDGEKMVYYTPTQGESPYTKDQT